MNRRNFFILHSAESSFTCVGMFQKAKLLEILKNFLLAGVEDLTCTDCNTTKKQRIQQICLKIENWVLKISE